MPSAGQHGFWTFVSLTVFRPTRTTAFPAVPAIRSSVTTWPAMAVTLARSDSCQRPAISFQPSAHSCPMSISGPPVRRQSKEGKTMRTQKRGGRGREATLWVVQGLLAALFLFAGGMKLVIPVEMLAEQSHMSGQFLRFIGVCEVLGAIGLILPRLLHIREGLTPLAAAGLVIIMVGATIITVGGGQPGAAIVPALVGTLSALVAYARRTTSTT